MWGPLIVGPRAIVTGALVTELSRVTGRGLSESDPCAILSTHTEVRQI